MKKTRQLKCLSLLLCVVLIAATALFTSGCGQKETPNTDALTTTTVATDQKAVRGEGATVFDFNVVDATGKTTVFEIHTDQRTVGEALLELGLIAGEDGPYGLYVKTVNGLTLDYDKDGKYWAFYENGKYAVAGVDSTAIVPNTTYMFKAEKA